MNKSMKYALILVTLVSLGLAIRAQLQLRAARVILEDDLSGCVDRITTRPPLPGVEAVAASAGEAARLQDLLRQVAALQAERDTLLSRLAAAELSYASQSNEARYASPPPVASNAFRRAAFEDRMAQIKRDDPARYEELQKQREELRQRMQTQADERVEFLQKIDTAGMTDAQRASHDKLVQAVEQARVMMAGIAGLSPEDAAAARQQLLDTIGTVSTLYQQERRYLLEQTGRAMGYPGAEAGQFADYIQQLYDQTSMPRGFGGRGPGSRDRGSGATGTPGVGAPSPER